VKSSHRKNFKWYLSMGVWLTIALIALVHSKLEWLKCFSHNLPLEYIDLMILRLLSRRSRNFLSLLSKAWNIIFHMFVILSHSFFWLKSHEDLQENKGDRLNLLVSLSTISWSDYLSWLGQSQNSRELWQFLLKNSLISLEIAEVWIWYWLIE